MEKLRAKEWARLAVEALEDKKALDIRILDISNVSLLADYFLIAGGANRSQMQAMCDEVEDKLLQAGAKLRQIEGYDHAAWILLDFGDVVIHLFDKENRLLYDLEQVWREGALIEPGDLTD